MSDFEDVAKDFSEKMETGEMDGIALIGKVDGGIYVSYFNLSAAEVVGLVEAAKFDVLLAAKGIIEQEQVH